MFMMIDDYTRCRSLRSTIPDSKDKKPSYDPLIEAYEIKTSL